MDNTIELGRRIRESRLKKGMSLSQLAAEVGRSSSSVRRWERGEVPPAKSVMPVLAGALDIDEAELEELRPAPRIAAQEHTAGGQVTKGPDTLEQPAVVPAVPREAAPVEISDVSDPEAPATKQRGFFEDIGVAWRSLTKEWAGWIRALATIAVLVALLVVLVWAVGELFSALSEVWDSFDAES